jgi:3-carboxy-cis,cis-muconate cycloisomerase
MRLFSSPSDTDAQTGDAAWLRAMLDFESSLAGALADRGLADASVAEEIGRVCGEGRDEDSASGPAAWDLEALGAGTARDGTPVPALLKQLRAKLSDDAKAVLHRGATSQDVVDTAAMLVAKRALAPLRADLDAATDAAATLAERHRADLAAGRTLLQQALPITFGLRAANWLGGLDDATTRLAAVESRLALQFAGAAGTLASLDGDGLAVADALARRLELPAATPWHTNRSRVVELAAALGEAAGAAGKVGTDVVLLAQTEVAEVAEGGEGGGSSTLPHKRNPAGAVAAVAAARRTPALVATLLAAMPAEEERAAGAWQSEPEALDDLLRLTGSAVAAIRRSLENLEAFPDRMRANLDLTDGLVMAESLAAALGRELGRAEAQRLVTEASRRAAAEARSLAEVAAEAPEIVAALGTEGILASLDPAAYLGATDELIDRALAAHHDRVNPRPPRN